MPPAFEQVTPHIYRLPLPFLRGRFSVNVWMIREDEGGWIEVDAGAPGYEQVVIDQVLSLARGDHPRVLVLTHGHVDHAAAAGRMRTLWKIPIAAGREEIPYLLGAERYGRIPARSPLYTFAQRSGPPLAGRNVHLPLDEGSRVGPLQVYHVPGHAPGMIALLHAGDRALLCADAFVSAGGKLTGPPALFTYDPVLTREAQTKLAALDFDHLLPSHGAPILNDGRAKAQAFVDSRGKRRR